MESVTSTPHSTSEFAWTSLLIRPWWRWPYDVMVAWTTLVCSMGAWTRHFLLPRRLNTSIKPSLSDHARPALIESSLSSLKGVFHAYFAWTFHSTLIELHQQIIYNLLTQETKHPRHFSWCSPLLSRFLLHPSWPSWNCLLDIFYWNNDLALTFIDGNILFLNAQCTVLSLCKTTSPQCYDGPPVNVPGHGQLQLPTGHSCSTLPASTTCLPQWSPGRRSRSWPTNHLSHHGNLLVSLGQLRLSRKPRWRPYSSSPSSSTWQHLPLFNCVQDIFNANDFDKSSGDQVINI